MSKTKKPKPDFVVIRLRVFVDRAAVESAKAVGYSMFDIREIIKAAGLSELADLLFDAEEQAERDARKNL